MFDGLEKKSYFCIRINMKFCSTRPERAEASFAPHALKGQKLLAQGNALGIIAISKAPCKGKSLMFCLEF